MQTSFESIFDTVIKSTVSAVSAGQKAAEALADSLEDAAAKLRRGEIRVDNAVARTRAQQGTLDTARSKLRNDG